MRDLPVLNLVRNHRNLRLFDAQRRIISHQIRFVCACVARVWKNVCMWHRRTKVVHECAWYLRAVAYVCKT